LLLYKEGGILFFIYDLVAKNIMFMGSGEISHLEAAKSAYPDLRLREYITPDIKDVLNQPNDYRLVYHRDLAVGVAIKPLITFTWANGKDYISGDGVDGATLTATITETHSLDKITELQLNIGGNQIASEVVGGITTVVITMESDYAVTIDIEADQAKYRYEKATLEVIAP
jgi:hypothetical protein